MKLDEKVQNLCIQIMGVTSAAGVDIGVCAEAHMCCLVSCAIAASHNDHDQAADLIAEAAAAMVNALRAGDYELRNVVRKGHAVN